MHDARTDMHCRFKPAEMVAGLAAINKTLLRACTIAYVFASREDAEKACSNMGLIAQKSNCMHTLTVSLRSPAELGWQRHAGGHFRQNVARLMDIVPNDVQTVIICAIPTEAIEAAGCTRSEKFTLAEHADDLKLLLPVRGGDDAIYSCAHIAKIYALEPAALVDARRKLEDAEGSEDADPAEIKLTIQKLIDEAAKETAITSFSSRSKTAARHLCVFMYMHGISTVFPVAAGGTKDSPSRAASRAASSRGRDCKHGLRLCCCSRDIHTRCVDQTDAAC